MEIPLFIGIVSKKEMRLDIYNTSPLGFIYFANPNRSILELQFRKEIEGKNVGTPIAQALDDWPDGKGDGKKYIVDLGNPIITINNEDIHDTNKLKLKKDVLKYIVSLEQENYLFRKLKTPFFRWIVNVETNQGFQSAWFHLTPPDFEIPNPYSSSLAQSIISIAINLECQGNKRAALELKPLLKKIKPEIVPAEIKSAFAHLFE